MVFRYISTSYCRGRSTGEFQAKLERRSKLSLHRFRFSGKTELPSAVFPRLCRDTRPAFQAGFVFLGLVISFRHEPVMSAFAEKDVTRDSFAIAIFAIRWICKRGYCATGQYRPQSLISH
jgi:hypothetical protein